MVVERNFLDVYPYWKWNAKTIPVFQLGEKITPTELYMEEGHTTAPKLLTGEFNSLFWNASHLVEPDLITLMDKNGIGTDATIAEHIAKIQERHYVVMEGGEFKPTTLGEALVAGDKFTFLLCEGYYFIINYNRL